MTAGLQSFSTFLKLGLSTGMLLISGEVLYAPSFSIFTDFLSEHRAILGRFSDIWVLEIKIATLSRAYKAIVIFDDRFILKKKMDIVCPNYLLCH